MKKLLLLLCILSFASSCVRCRQDVGVHPRDFLKGKLVDYTSGSDKRMGVLPPPIQKPYQDGAILIDLVAVKDLAMGDAPLSVVIRERRSRRNFCGEKISLAELSYLLWSTQGIGSISRMDDGHVDYHLRTVPSGGARHPFETYLLLNRVEGVDPGVYRYLPVEHKLLAVYSGVGLEERISGACFGQKFTSTSAVVFVWAAVPYRTEWKYTGAAYKMIAIEAGHICQNLYLACESMNLGTCAMLGYNQLEMDRLIGVDGVDEFTVYIAPVGRVATEPDQR